MKEKRFINSFTIFTISIAFVHFILETLYTIKFGQTWAGLLPDYIAVSLMWAGGIIALKNIKGVWEYYVVLRVLLFVFIIDFWHGDLMV